MGDGYYSILTENNNCLDVENFSTKDGTNIISWPQNGGRNQKFKFIEVIEGKKTIEDGTYIISSALNENQKLNVNNNIAENQANVNIFHNNDTWGQVWNVKYLDDGYYSITSYLNDNKSLDVYGAAAKNGANIQLYDYHGRINQRWIIKDAGGGYYNIVSELDHLYLDIFGRNSADGTNVILWSGHNSNNQKFSFDKVTKDKKTIDDGTYIISSAINENQKLNVNNNIAENQANVNILHNNDSWGQVWNVKYLDDGYYSITSYLNDNKSLDACNGNVLLNEYSNDNQRWIIKYMGDGYYNIVSGIDRLYLDIFNGNIYDGNNVILWKGNGNLNQKFRFEKTTISRIEDGLYTINSSLDLNKVLTINSEIAYNEANVQLETFDGSNSQKWYIYYLKNGYYKIISALSNVKSLDIYGGSSKNGANIQLYDYHGRTNQQWIIKDVGDGYYNIVSGIDRLYLDIFGRNSADGTNVILWNGHNDNNQKFMLKKASFNKTPEILKDGYYTISNVNNNLSIDGQVAYNEANVIMKNSNSENTKWYIKNIGNNLYEIRYALNRNKVLDIYMGNNLPGSNVQIYASNNGINQKWYIVGLHDGNYKIISAKGYSPLTDVNNDIKIYPNSRKLDQKFKILPTDPVTYGRTIADGYYTIGSYLNHKQVLDVKNASVASGTNVQLSTLHNGLGQIWNIKYLENGLYSITSALNPKRKLTSFNDNIQINKDINNENQKWYILELEDGSFSIISANNGKYVSSIGNYVNNGTNVGTNNFNNTDFQKFILKPYSGTKTYKGIDISKWQGNIDWKLLYKEDPHFVIMRVGRGLADLGKDVKFEEYYKSAKDLDIPVGVYIYSFATNMNEAKKEAEYVIEWLGGKKIELPVFYDMEYSGQLYLGKEVLTRLAETFCATIVSNDYHCGIYANIYWLMNYLDGKKLSNNYPIWLAHWTGADDYNSVLNNIDKYKSPYNLSPYKYWQFSSLGKYPGITENTVDLDFGYDIFD